jgi:hypothetical protein
MAAIQRDYPSAKGKMSVAPVQWLPGALASMLPFFAVIDEYPGALFLRADDPNLYGIYTAGLMTTPVVEKNGIRKNANKGFNFYSSPWCIPTLPARDLGRRIEITSIHSSVTDYITRLYTLVGRTPITLTDWKLEQKGYVKAYQILQGSSYVNVGNSTYFGAAKEPYTQVSGVSEQIEVASPLISGDFTYNGTDASGNGIITYQLPYNTFYAVDTPIVLSAVDTAHPNAPKIYFTLLNNVTLYNGPNYNG